jgi:hypothetical protein
VPVQALYLMNGDFIQEVAKAFVARTIADSSDMQLAQMYRLAFNRLPDAEELKLAFAFLGHDKSGRPRKPPLEAWQEFAQVLLMSNEFAFTD